MFGSSIRLSKPWVGLIGLFFIAVVYYAVQMQMSEGTTFDFQIDKDTVCLKRLLLASIKASQRGGNMVKKVNSEKDLEVKSKGKTAEGVMDPVTMGDMLSHEQMYFSLAKMFPRIKIVSEEKSQKTPDVSEILAMDLDTTELTKQLGSDFQSEVPADELTVWIDPLDATKEYTENLMQFVTTMVCVARKGEPIIGVIHLPFENQTVWAWKGHGRSPIPDFQTVPKHTNFDNMKIIVSRSHAGKVADLAKKAFGDKSEIIPAGGAGFKALNVAQRKVDAYIHMTAIKKWDICAGHALLKTMQGDMTDLYGNDIDYSAPPSEGDRNLHVKLMGGLVATYQNHKLIVKRVKKAKEEDQIVVT